MTDELVTPPTSGATDDGEPAVTSAAPAAPSADAAPAALAAPAVLTAPAALAAPAALTAPAAPAVPALGAPAIDAAPFRAPFPEVLPVPSLPPPEPVARAAAQLPPQRVEAAFREHPSAPDPSPITEPAAVFPEAREDGPPPPPRREARDEAPSVAPRDPAAGRGRREAARSPRGPRPDLALSSEPLYRDSAGYRMRLEPPDLARLRELPGSKGKTDLELGETFFDGQAARFAASLAEDVPSPAEVRVVVDPYSRQAFLAVEKKIRSILSF